MVQIQEKKELNGEDIFNIIYTNTLRYNEIPSDIQDNKDMDYLLNEFHYYIGSYYEDMRDIASFTIALLISTLIVGLIKTTYENGTKNISYDKYLENLNFKYLVMFLWYELNHKEDFKSEHIYEWNLITKKRNETNKQANNIRHKYNFTSDIYNIKNVESMKIALKQKLQESKVNVNDKQTINDLEILLNSTQNNSKFPLYYNFYEFNAIKQILDEYKQPQTNNLSGVKKSKNPKK